MQKEVPPRAFAIRRGLSLSLSWEEIESVQPAFAATRNSGAFGGKEKERKSQLHLRPPCLMAQAMAGERGVMRERQGGWASQRHVVFLARTLFKKTTEVGLAWGFTDALNQKAKPHHGDVLGLLESCPASAQCIRLLSSVLSCVKRGECQTEAMAQAAPTPSSAASPWFVSPTGWGHCVYVCV